VVYIGVGVVVEYIEVEVVVYIEVGVVVVYIGVGVVVEYIEVEVVEYIEVEVLLLVEEQEQVLGMVVEQGMAGALGQALGQVVEEGVQVVVVLLAVGYMAASWEHRWLRMNVPWPWVEHRP